MTNFEYAAMTDNVQAMVEINAQSKYADQMIRVVKGRKVPIGTVGKVFYVKRNHYSSNQWFGWSTRLGFETDTGDRFFTDSNNVEIIR